MATPTFVLSIHAGYGCRDRGACCTAGWPIPIESAPLDAAERALATGMLRAAREATPPFIRLTQAPASAPALVAVDDTGCVFYRSAGVARCAIHRVLGHAALPLACRQFPRVSVSDPRGTSITLSHYCPTAADMLAASSPLTIVDSAPGFPAGGEYVGLDATTSLPPLLRPDMAMDWEAWWHWERRAVETFDRAATADEALEQLHAAVEHARTWRPSDGSLLDRVNEAFDRPLDTASNRGERAARALLDDVRASAPAEYRHRVPEASGPPMSEPTRRHVLAAHAFANWTAYAGLGLRSWLRSIEAADALIGSGATAGEADLWLRHLADPFVLTTRFGSAEGPAGPNR